MKCLNGVVVGGGRCGVKLELGGVGYNKNVKRVTRVAKGWHFMPALIVMGSVDKIWIAKKRKA